MASRDINDLYEPLKVIAEKALKIAELIRLPIVIICTLRNRNEQLALYAQGRENITETNKLRFVAGLSPITIEENKRKVTNIKSSYHTTFPKSMAFDFAVGTRKSISWIVKEDLNNNEVPDYKEFATICKILDPDNIEWGGDWEFKDHGHIQWKNGINIGQTINTKDVKKVEDLNLVEQIKRYVKVYLKNY